MEVKKSYKADLDNRRASGFLIGLVVVLSLFLAALEFTTHGGMPEAGDDILDDISQDMEMAPAVNRDDMVAAAPRPSAGGSPEKLNIVDRRVEETSGGTPLLNAGDVQNLLGVGLGGVADIADTPISLVSAGAADEASYDASTMMRAPSVVYTPGKKLKEVRTTGLAYSRVAPGGEAAGEEGSPGGV